MIIKNINAFIDNKFTKTDITIENGVFTSLDSTDFEGINNYEDLYAIPGLVDIHTHGCAGYDFSSASPDEINRMRNYYLNNGITTIIPTTVALSDENIKKAVDNITYAMNDKTGADIAGINLEGPYLSPEKCGAHDISLLKEPDIDFVNSLGDTIKVVHVAPEYTKAFDFIKEKIISPLEEIWKKVLDVWDKVYSKIKEVTDSVKNIVGEAFKAVYDSVSEKLQSVFDKVKEIWDGIKEKITEVVKNAADWGKDLITNFVGGIKDNIPNLADAVTGVADNIRERLHFSEPDKGPLSDFSTYAPDMMATFARGIRDNENLVTDQIDRSFNFGDLIKNQSSATPALAGAAGGDIVIPIYLGNELLQTLVVDSLNIANYRSGGR